MNKLAMSIRGLFSHDDADNTGIYETSQRNVKSHSSYKINGECVLHERTTISDLNWSDSPTNMMQKNTTVKPVCADTSKYIEKLDKNDISTVDRAKEPSATSNINKHMSQDEIKNDSPNKERPAAPSRLSNAETIVGSHPQTPQCSDDMDGRLAATLHKKIGKGTYGEVFRCGKYAIKKTHQLDAGLREIAIGGALANHPNILSPLAVWVADDYLVIKYIAANTDLGRWFKDGTILTKKKTEKTCIINSILNGLAHMHAMGVVHCDLKPDNILISPEGVPIICDFGLSKISGIKSDTCAQTITYRAPEVSTDRDFLIAHPALDMWSFGILYGEIMTSRHIRWDHIDSDDHGEDGLVFVMSWLGFPFKIKTRHGRRQVYKDAIKSGDLMRLIASLAISGKPKSKSLSVRDIDIIYNCLQLLPENRAAAHQLLSKTKNDRISACDKHLVISAESYLNAAESPVSASTPAWPTQKFSRKFLAKYSENYAKLFDHLMNQYLLNSEISQQYANERMFAWSVMSILSYEDPSLTSIKEMTATKKIETLNFIESLANKIGLTELITTS